MQLRVLPTDDRMTNSRRTCLGKCDRKHLIAYELGIRPMTMAKPLRMGDAYHAGLYVLNSGGTRDDANAAATAPYDRDPPQFKSDHEWGVERETVLNLINGYAWRYFDQEVYEGHKIRRILAAELPFDLVINGVRYCGKIDGIAELWDGRLAVAEYKTADDDLKPGSDYWLRLRIDSQISGYYVAARMLGYPVQTVLYDVTAKPGIRPRQIPVLDEQGRKIVLDADGRRMLKEKKKKDGSPAAGDGEPYESANAEKGWVLHSRVETPQEYGDRLRADIAERPEIYYGRQEIPRLESDLDEWMREVAADQHKLEYFRWKNVWPRNSSACILPYKCEYFGLCHTGWTPEAGLPAGFRQVDDPHQEIAGATE